MNEKLNQASPEEIREMLHAVCPEKYRDKLFLTQADMQEILEISRTKSYEILREAPFRVEKIGAQIRVPAFGFWTWYLTGTSLDPEREGQVNHKASNTCNR